MARFRLSLLARADLAQILATSLERWGIEGKRRYAAALAAGMRKVAAEPEGPTTRDRVDLSRGIRSFHLRHAHAGKNDAKVRGPVHVLYYRVVREGLVEIVRVPTRTHGANSAHRRGPRKVNLKVIRMRRRDISKGRLPA